VTKAVALGDLSKQIEVDARGEILDLKNTVNGMVVRCVYLSSLSNFPYLSRYLWTLSPPPNGGGSISVGVRRWVRSVCGMCGVGMVQCSATDLGMIIAVDALLISRTQLLFSSHIFYIISYILLRIVLLI
jgi:hypothetical protein